MQVGARGVLAKAVHGPRRHLAEAADVFQRVVEPVGAVGGARGAVFDAQAVAAERRGRDVRIEGREAHADRIDGADGIGQQVGLAAGGDRTPGAAQAHDGRAVEELRGIGLGAGIEVEPGFQVEHGMQAATQVLAAAQAEAAGVVHAARDARGRGGAGRVGRRHAGGVSYAEIGDAVEDDAALRGDQERRAGGCRHRDAVEFHGVLSGKRAAQ